MATEKCVKCGAELTPEQNFCPACGEPRPPKITCKKCGAELKHGQAFCPNCGAAVMSDTASNSDHDPVAVTKKNPKKAKTLLFAGAILIIVLAIALKFVWPWLSSITQTFKESTDLQVICADVDCPRSDYWGYVNVKNTGKKAIRDFEITYVLFDANGYSVKPSYADDIFKSRTYTSANILPGDTYGLNAYVDVQDNVRYMEAIVSKITYTDGSEWEAQGISAWANNAVKNFSVDAYKQKIENMKADSQNAENNPYVQTTLSRIGTQWGDGIKVTVTNTSSKTITSLTFLVMQYDQNGYGVKYRYGNFCKPNCNLYRIEGTLLSGKTATGSNNDSFFSDDSKYQTAIVYEVKFSDGTVWINPYALQWLIYNEDMR